MKLRFGNLIGRDAQLPDEACALAFGKRHRAGLYLLALPILLFVSAGFLIAWTNGHFAPFVLAWVCVLTVVAYLGLVYRCPRCGEVPSSSQAMTTGVLLFPKRCSKCKAPLLPAHRFGQD